MSDQVTHFRTVLLYSYSYSHNKKTGDICQTPHNSISNDDDRDCDYDDDAGEDDGDGDDDGNGDGDHISLATHPLTPPPSHISLRHSRKLPFFMLTFKASTGGRISDTVDKLHLQ